MSDDLVTPLRNASYLAFEDGTNDYTTAPKAAYVLEAQAARIAELEEETQNLRDDLASNERERAHQHGRADRNAAEYAREQAKREALRQEIAAKDARIAELEAALRHLDDLIVDLEMGRMELYQVSDFINDALAGGKTDD